ncbi:MAG: chemotaxis protein [Gammaproteobacteria bacterium]|nr:chemotaxis protein [Gammaproteobacteria bacterium]
MAFLDKITSVFTGSNKAVSNASAQSVDKRVVALGVALILSIIVMVGLFITASLLSRPNAIYLDILSKQQVLSQQIAVDVNAAARADSNAMERLEANRDRYSTLLRKLELGDEELDIPPLSSAFNSEYTSLKQAWNRYGADVSSIIDNGDTLLEINEHGRSALESMPELITLSDGVLKALEKVEAPRKNTIAAARQLALMQSISSSLFQIVSGSPTLSIAAENLSVDSAEVETLLLALLKGNSSLGISRFTNSGMVSSLLSSADVYDVAKNNIVEVLNSAETLAKVNKAVENVLGNSESLLTTSSQLIDRIDSEDGQLSVLSVIGYALGILSLVLLISVVLSVINVSRVQLAESRDQNDKNQRAILRLLDEMTNLADGDLSTHTTVTEDITGAIADSVNYSIDALRDLVGTINQTSVQVSSAVHKTQTTTGQLAQASNAQTKEIISASKTITTISKSMLDVSEKAADSAEVARKSVSIAHKGGETVRQTIAGMETIREQIQETSKRIKRLGESSQEIGDIVNLITEISDQTNILALNAAIQASMAGEAGRGFAVVADEVQRLAERTGDATKQIEALVKTIQADTNEATVSMEQSTTNVVKGAKLTENAGGALDRIEQVSMNLAQRILEISDATKSQADESVKITRTMDTIQQVTQKTSTGSKQASHSIGELTQMVGAMQKSVAGFKLPGIGSSDKTVMADMEDLSSFDLMDS